MGPRPRLPREFHPRLCSLSSSPPRHVPSPCPIPRCCLVTAVIPRGRDRAKWAAGLPNMRVVWKRTMTRWGARCNQCLGGVWGRRAETVVGGAGGILQLDRGRGKCLVSLPVQPSIQDPTPSRAATPEGRLAHLTDVCTVTHMPRTQNVITTMWGETLAHTSLDGVSRSSHWRPPAGKLRAKEKRGCGGLSLAPWPLPPRPRSLGFSCTVCPCHTRISVALAPARGTAGAPHLGLPARQARQA